MSEIEIALQGTGSTHTVQGQAAWSVMHHYAAILATPWPKVMVGVRVSDTAVTAIDLLAGNGSPYPAQTAIARAAVEQLLSYFQDPLYRFSLPIVTAGTPFQRKVWDALRHISPGETRSYSELARQLGSGPRAIGGACRANPLALVIPCHRVVAAKGLGGFMGVASGDELEIKQYLLAHERVLQCRV